MYRVHPTNSQLLFESAESKFELTKQRRLLQFLSILKATGASSPPYHNYNHDSNHDLINDIGILTCCDACLPLEGTVLPILIMIFMPGPADT
jgi:hypothetical protein